MVAVLRTDDVTQNYYTELLPYSQSVVRFEFVETAPGSFDV